MGEQRRTSSGSLLTRTLERISSPARPIQGTKAASRLLHLQSLAASGGRDRKPGYELPPPLPDHIPPRTHTLTPPPFGISIEETVTLHEQLQSRLLNLPDKVLVLIYEQAVGKKLIHIVRRKEKLGHTNCISRTGKPDNCKDEECRGLKLPRGFFVRSSAGAGDLIQLLQTCRKVYASAISILYSSNTFDFDSMESLISLSCTVIPQRFDSIWSMQLDFCFSLSANFSESTPINDSPRWHRTWAVIGSMKSLQKLWVRITWSRLKLNAAEEKSVMEPLWMASNLTAFEVSLPPAWGGVDVDWSDAPFKVIRRKM